MGERYIEELSDGTLAFKAPAGSLTTDDDANLKRVLLKVCLRVPMYIYIYIYIYTYTYVYI